MPEKEVKAQFDMTPITKVVAATTKAIYKCYLNKLAKEGYTNQASLVKNQAKVLKIVKDYQQDKQKTFMNSIFYALSNLDNKDKKKYYDYFQLLKLNDPRLQAYKASLEADGV